MIGNSRAEAAKSGTDSAATKGLTVKELIALVFALDLTTAVTNTRTSPINNTSCSRTIKVAAEVAGFTSAAATGIVTAAPALLLV